MGRYDGEDYDERPTSSACSGGRHDFAINGECWGCGRTRGELIAQAKATLQRLGGDGAAHD